MRRSTSRDMWDQLQLLEAENAGLKKAVSAKKVKTADLRYTWKALYCIGERMYLEAPQWKKGKKGPVLHAEVPLQNEQTYLEQHPKNRVCIL